MNISKISDLFVLREMNKRARPRSEEGSSPPQALLPDSWRSQSGRRFLRVSSLKSQQGIFSVLCNWTVEAKLI